MIRYTLSIIGLFFLTGLLGCSSVPKEAGFKDVQNLVGSREDHRVYWERDSKTDPEIEQILESVLKSPLTSEGAVQIALLKNPNLQAVYEELGITQANVIEASLLDNPVVFGQVRFPDTSGASNNLEFGITQNFLNILMMPYRKKLSTIRFEQVKLQVADEVIRTAAEVRKSYYSAMSAKQVRNLRNEIALSAEASFDLAQRLHNAGNISDLQLARENAQFEEARLELANSEAIMLDSREYLTRLMGLWGNLTDYRLPDQLPDIPEAEIPLERLESIAIENRLDLASERKAIEALTQALGITIDWRWVGEIEIGISSERKTDRTWVTGPSLAIELPIFDQRQTEIARLEAQLRRSQKRLAAQAIEIRSEVRRLRNRLITQRNIVNHYQKNILPLRERVVQLTLQQYNYMLIGAFDLIVAKQMEFNAYQKYIESVRDYWIYRTEMQRSLGGKLPDDDQMEMDVHEHQRK